MSGNIQYPDGVAADSLGFIPPMLAPELTVPQVTGNDLSWVAGPGRAKGVQPITSTNPDGDIPGIPVMSLRSATAGTVSG